MSYKAFKECTKKEKIVDRFRALILAHCENAESTFTVLLNDLSSDLKESNTNMEEFFKLVTETIDHAKGKVGILHKFEAQGSISISDTANLNNSRSNSETSTSQTNGRQTRSGRVQGICNSCGISKNLISGRCRDCIAQPTTPSTSSTSAVPVLLVNDQASTPEQPVKRVHCSNCGKRLAVKREPFGTCLYCEGKLNNREDPNMRSDRQAMKMEQVEISD